MLVVLNIVLVAVLITILAMPLVGAVCAFLLLVSLSHDKPLGHWSRTPWLPFPVAILGFCAGRLLGAWVLHTATSLTAALTGGA